MLISKIINIPTNISNENYNSFRGRNVLLVNAFEVFVKIFEVLLNVLTNLPFISLQGYFSNLISSI